MKIVIDIKPEEFTVIKDIIRDYLPLKRVLVYGSRVRQTADRYSDLDIVLRRRSIDGYDFLSFIRC